MLFRSEKKLQHLFDALDAQSILPDEIIFINDHSTDSTEEMLERYCLRRSNVRYINSYTEGKKSALKEGINNATGSYILLTDADCIPHSHWVEEVVTYCALKKPDLLMGTVVLSPTNSFLLKFQALDFASLVASGAGAALMGYPIFGNGANLIVRREAWLEAENALRSDIPSGDDVFLIHNIKKRGGKIEFLKSTSAIVETQGVESWRALLRQRQRWGGKSVAYKDVFTIFVACIVLLMNLLIVTCMVTYFSATNSSTLFWYLWIQKFIIDSILVIPFLFATKQQTLIPYWPIVSLLYPFYLIICGIMALFVKNSWK